MTRIAIVGGGIAGLAAAYELTRQGHDDFVLYEASARLGGIVETVQRDGFVIECGPDSWVTEKPWARQLAIELGLESELIPSNDDHRRTYLLNEDRLVAMPDGMRMMVPTDFEAIDGSPLFSEEAKRAYREEPSRAEELKSFAAALSADADESVATFIQRHFGDEVVEKIAAPLLAGVFGGDIRQLSAKAVMAPFVKMEREDGSLIVALQHQQRAAGAKAAVFTTLKVGLQGLIDAMAATLSPETVRLEQAVLSLTRRDNNWQVSTSAGEESFDAVVFATPIHVAREILAGFHPELEALLKIDATSSIVAAFGFDRDQSPAVRIPEGFGFLVPQGIESGSDRSEPGLLACTFVNQKFYHRVPDGCTLLRAFYGGDAAPTLLGETDETILGLARGQLSRVFGPLPSAQIELVRRWPRSLPQYAVGHRSRIARVEEIVEGIPGLHLIGNAFHGVGLPDLVRQGRSVAAGLLSS